MVIPQCEDLLDRPFGFLSASFRTVLFGLLAIDLTFILIHGLGFVLHRLGLTGKIPSIFWIAQDGGLPEDFNYLKWAIIIVALIWVALRDRWWTPFAWSLVFLLILIDDSLQVHETFGALIARSADLQPGFFLEPSDLGELCVFGLMGLAVVALTGLTFVKGPGVQQQLSLTYAAVIIALGFFGVGVDALHQAIVYLVQGSIADNLLPHVFALIEDGGEMVVASVATALTVAPPARLQVAQHQVDA